MASNTEHYYIDNDKFESACGKGFEITEDEYENDPSYTTDQDLVEYQQGDALLPCNECAKQFLTDWREYQQNKLSDQWEAMHL